MCVCGGGGGRGREMGKCVRVWEREKRVIDGSDEGK